MNTENHADSLARLTAALLILLAATLQGGCTARAIHEGVADRGPVVVAAPVPEAARRKVAIGRFSNETTYGAGLFTDEHGDRLGKQAADILARHLAASQRFLVLERQDLGKLQAEAQLMGLSEEQFRKHLIGVDAIILGSVVELGRETTGGIWLVGKKKTQRARARVVLRLVDPRSGAVFYTAEGAGDATLESTSTLGFGGTAGWDSTLEGEAIDAAIVNMIHNVIATLDARIGPDSVPLR
ncbi:MAG: curli production assembly protein CsgG [Deltaproteobacteria bacterium]|nr:curli production assembly protein CsgG [Deltaproteobacteria bacterium]